VIYARYTDSQSGASEYRLTNIRREAPPPDLFVIPSDSKILDPMSAGADNPRPSQY